jgi:hypothetical protein
MLFAQICTFIFAINARLLSLQDSELNELRATIEALKRQSGLSIPDPTILSPGAGRRHTSPGMVNTNDYVSSPLHQIHQQSPHHGNRPGFNTLPMPTGKKQTDHMTSFINHHHHFLSVFTLILSLLSHSVVAVSILYLI